MSVPRDFLLIRLAEAEARFAQLESERERLRVQIKELRDELGRHEPVSTLAPSSESLGAPMPGVPQTPAEKIALFRRLFRGRADVFPRRWENSKKGTKGYAPVCANEWVPIICEKPRVKCSECPNQAFTPLTDQVIERHLLGQDTIGIYPMLMDETCWFLAADFDKDSWQEDVTAFAATCRQAGVPCAVERSRSGNGAHVWFFFAAPIPASNARTMGCHFLTETMARRHELRMASYDRLFPNQDTMPRGGFGNLIALPLQGKARKLHNTVFLDESLREYADQWAYLSSVIPIDGSHVERIARDAAKQGRVVGVRLPELTDEEEMAPWTRSPSRRSPIPKIDGPLPAEVRAVLGQRLFVEKDGLPSSLLNEIKRIAAFQNREFYKKQALRLSTALTPRVIACAEELPQHIALPRGCTSALTDILRAVAIQLSIDDQRFVGEPLDVRFHGELTPQQREAARAMTEHDTGVFVAPPGTGKTVLGVFLAARRGVNTLVLVHRKPLLDQWVAQLAMFLGIGEKEIGRIGGGKRAANGRLDVAMLQSLTRKGNVDDIVARYGHVIIDECHHVPAVSFERVLSEVKARYVTGLTATPRRRDGLQAITEMQIGPVRFTVAARDAAASRPFSQRLIVRETSFQVTGPGNQPSIQETYRALARDERRNELILNDVIQAIEAGRSPIVLTERRDHLDFFSTRLKPFVKHLIVLRGGMNASQNAEVASRRASLPDGEERLLLATGRYIGEGFDDARLDTLFLAMPISWKGTLVQYAGRLHRLHPLKTEVRVFDYVDSRVPMLQRMFEKRLQAYRAIGYARGEAPLGYAEPREEHIIEYDEEALRQLPDGSD